MKAGYFSGVNVALGGSPEIPMILRGKAAEAEMEILEILSGCFFW